MSFPGISIQPAGDCALLVILGNRVDLQTNYLVHRFAHTLTQHGLPGILETIPGYTTVLINYDPMILPYPRLKSWLEEFGESVEHSVVASNRVVIPVLYGGENGPDLAFVAEYCSLTQEAVIEIHTAREYPVFMMGFMPGFPYLGGLDPSISAPRLNTPRELVKAGSVGIAGEQTGIYPLDSPGGWRIIGKTDQVLFDINRDPPFLIGPGDRVKFVPVK